MSFYRGGAFWLGILVFFWLGYLYISGNRTVNPDPYEIMYKNRNNPVIQKYLKDSLVDCNSSYRLLQNVKGVE